MMLGLLLALTLSAPPSARLEYERKCLYCHSEEVTEGRRFTEPQWSQVIERMRAKAPLLITRGDVITITRYMTQTLRLLPPVRPPVPETKPAETAAPVAPVVEEITPASLALEQEAFALLQKRCSKCHTMGRVYGRLDTLERSLQTLERMRFKTGSGITDHDMEVLEAYLRKQFD